MKAENRIFVDREPKCLMKGCNFSVHFAAQLPTDEWCFSCNYHRDAIWIVGKNDWHRIKKGSIRKEKG